MDSIWAVVIAIVPSIGIGFLFYKILKAILEGDRNERLAHARWEASQSDESPDAVSGVARAEREAPAASADSAR